MTRYKYDLSIVPYGNNEECEQFKKFLEEWSKKSGMESHILPNEAIISIPVSSIDSIFKCRRMPDHFRWYSCDGDMKKISVFFPKLVFCLKGETNPPLWLKYFVNGKVQVCKAKISYDGFDETKLC